MGIVVMEVWILGQMELQYSKVSHDGPNEGSM